MLKIKYCKDKVNNFEEFFDGFYYLIAQWVAVVQTMSFCSNENLFKDLLKYFSQGTAQCFFRKANRISAMISNAITILFSSLLLLSLYALIHTIYLVLVHDKNLQESFELPVYCVLPFEVNSWSDYIIAFCWTYSNYVITIMCRTIVTTIQLTIWIYFVASIQMVRSQATIFNNVT